MKVRATRTGYIGLQRHKEGSEFDWPDGVKLGSWVETVGSDADSKKAAAEIDKAKARADHAKAMRDSIGAASVTESAPAK